jgi:hypothetical protein
MEGQKSARVASGIARSVLDQRYYRHGADAISRVASAVAAVLGAIRCAGLLCMEVVLVRHVLIGFRLQSPIHRPVGNLGGEGAMALQDA